MGLFINYACDFLLRMKYVEYSQMEGNLIGVIELFRLFPSAHIRSPIGNDRNKDKTN